MTFEILKEDPLNILNTTKYVVENAQHVFVDDNKINSDFTNKIFNRFNSGVESEYEAGFKLFEKVEDNLQTIFIYNAVNFCFWPDKEEEKWKVEWPLGGKSDGGCYGLLACFKRAFAEGVPILDPKYLSSITLEEARIFFRGSDNVEIPLLKERKENLKEVGSILLEKFNGKIISLIELSKYDGIEVVKNITDNFPCYRDISNLDGKEIVFLKRAQLCVNDFSIALKNTKNNITNTDKLTAFADYKLPQLLRAFEIINYNEDLEKEVDSMIKLTHDSRKEIEIRSATIYAVELLRQNINKLTAGEIDNTLWLMSQEPQYKLKPYHRSRTIFY